MRRITKSITRTALLFIATYLVIACQNQAEYHIMQPVDQVYNHLDTENSRWFFFSSACRPFGMVNLSPDTQVGGAWGSGYHYNTDTVKGFSHIHAWQLSGLSVMPVSLSEGQEKHIFSDFYSSFSHQTEKVKPGYHYLELERYRIEAELSSTQRVGFHKYTFNGQGEPAVLLNLNTTLGPCENVEGSLTQAGDKHVYGELTNTPTRRRPKPTKVFFHIDSDVSINEIIKDDATGNYLLIFAEGVKQVQLKAGISYTSSGNAKENIDRELAHWDFTKVRKESKEEWNALLSRIQVEGGTTQQVKRFYTDLWHALQGRRTISDANGAYPDYTGEEFRIGQVPLNTDGNPKFKHYNSDAFWGAQWTINTLWGLVYPDIYKEFVQSMMLYYKDGGLVPRGPSGGNYTYVMTGASSTPFIVSAIQKGIINEGLDEIYEALIKNHMPLGIMAKAGYEHDTYLGGGLKHYINNGWVPYPIPEGKFGYHQDGASLTLEYAYQDWTLAQLAKKLGKNEDYNYFMKRSKYYQNVFDKSTGWMRPRNIKGEWLSDFDPYNYEHGFNEANGAQATWFVPHDIEGLANLMGGKDKTAERLNEAFQMAQKIGFTAGDAHDKELHPEFNRIPVNYGNQPSMQTAMIFSHLDRPDLSNYWGRAVVDSVFSGLAPNTGYNGDEDQGFMGSLAVLMKIGLFQLNGGTCDAALYQIGSPIFNKVTIQLHPDFYSGIELLIETNNNGVGKVFVEDVQYNGANINGYEISHEHLTNGGQLVLTMSAQNTK